MLSLSLSDVPLVGWYIGVLVVLEGLLSADNALVLAVMVRSLSKADQKRVLRYGIWGAIGFRVVAVSLSAVLLKFWFFKVGGGLYLIYLASSHFLKRSPDPGVSGEYPADADAARRFWRVVASVTMTDIAFSIDSILAAVAMADSFPDRFGNSWKLLIVFAGGILGIITMRFVVRYFVVLLDRFPGLEQGAYLLVAWIGLKLLISGFHDRGILGGHVPEWLFWSVMLVIAVSSLLWRPKTAVKPGAEHEKLELYDRRF